MTADNSPVGNYTDHQIKDASRILAASVPRLQDEINTLYGELHNLTLSVGWILAHPNDRELKEKLWRDKENARVTLNKVQRARHPEFPEYIAKPYPQDTR